MIICNCFICHFYLACFKGTAQGHARGVDDLVREAPVRDYIIRLSCRPVSNIIGPIPYFLVETLKRHLLKTNVCNSQTKLSTYKHNNIYQRYSKVMTLFHGNCFFMSIINMMSACAWERKEELPTVALQRVLFFFKEL